MIKIDPRYYPAILLLTFLLFVLLGLALGFRPEHGGRNPQGGFLLIVLWINQQMDGLNDNSDGSK